MPDEGRKWEPGVGLNGNAGNLILDSSSQISKYIEDDPYTLQTA